ncbi:hypothetical protein [Nonomuraea sp. NPDC050643]|uniref:hypothetical protein n=1 Tax=Nonomuraea sp. NPDC050643 TaxID=3155660 RepID=UPI0033D1BF8A
MGDVLSPRWSTDDTDEQPAIQVVGNETYILPPDKNSLTGLGEPQRIDGMRDVLDGPAPHDVLGGPSGAHDVLSAPSGSPSGSLSGAHDVAGRHDLGGPHDPLNPDDPLGLQDSRGDLGDLGGHSGPHDLLGGHSGPHRVESRQDDDGNPYLPLDRGYESGRDDDDFDDDRPKRGFLGSGWTDDANAGASGGEREVRRRTRKLLIAAAAVVLVGVGAGWMLTGTSSDDPCNGGHCASAGEVSAPTDTEVPEEAPVEEEPEETADEPAISDSAEPTETGPANPPSTQQRVRPTREPASQRPTPTRTSQPTSRATSKPTRTAQNPTNDTADNGELNEDTPKEKQESKQQATEAPVTQPPATTQAPAPTPTEEKKGLLDILFPWA